MATEAQRMPDAARERSVAPKFPASSASLAAIYAAAEDAGAPISARSPGDEARNILGEVSCLVELLSAGFDECGKQPSGGQGEMLLRSANTYARAFDGLGRLIDLAAFHVSHSLGERP